jgi:hypothetical protein
LPRVPASAAIAGGGTCAVTDRVGGGVGDLPLPEHPATKSSPRARSGLDDLKRTSIPNLAN